MITNDLKTVYSRVSVIKSKVQVFETQGYKGKEHVQKFIDGLRRELNEIEALLKRV
ncbi:MAG: hypothetical protein AABX04_05950 [Nanoarchaeota archaeon]